MTSFIPWSATGYRRQLETDRTNKIRPFFQKIKHYTLKYTQRRAGQDWKSFWKIRRKQKKCERNVKFTPFGSMSRTFRGYLGHKLVCPDAQLSIEGRYKVIKFLRQGFEKSEEQKKVTLYFYSYHIYQLPAIVLQNKFRALKINKPCWQSKL